MAAFIHLVSSVWLFLIGVSVLGISGSAQQLARTNHQVRTLPTYDVNQADLQGLIPTVPSPENVNCHVEVRLLQTVGGQCIRFGRSHMWSCQSGVHVQMSPECERRNRRRERTQSRPTNRRP